MEPVRNLAPATNRSDVPLRDAILSQLTSLGIDIADATDADWYCATALAVREIIVRKWLSVRRANRQLRKKRVYYLSIEFLIGRILADSLTNLGLLEEARKALAGFGVDLDRIKDAEPDAALGNGGLGRLAACYMDSMASLGVPSYGYGLRYEHGLFEQRIHKGWQEEWPEKWLRSGNPWELPRPDKEYPIGFGGSVEYSGGDEHTPRAIWHPSEVVLATTHDIPIAGWRGRNVNVLRLWGARAPDPIHLAAFNDGDHMGAMVAQNRADAITRILYPNDHTPHGQELRLRQEYFFTAASIGDIVRRHLEQFGDIRSLADSSAIQLNDTHPAIAVAELMRVLVDQHAVAWADAWRITRATLSFTNHTLLPEALESWPVDLFDRLLPRHLQIIYLINLEHLENAKRNGFTDPDFLSHISLISEGGERRVRMANLAFVGSHHVNGVSGLHTELLKTTLFDALAQASPTTTIVNKTNGITFRRWLYVANPKLTKLIVDTLGESVLDEPQRLIELEKHAGDAGFVAAYRAVRADNKRRFGNVMYRATGTAVDPDALFDVHIKRIHEYKRQSLNLLETVALYLQIRDEPDGNYVPRVKIFAGKAAPGYQRAKLLIKLAHDIAHLVNADPVVRDRLKVVFTPNYNVSLAEKIIPAADLSEQISTAGMEASGTGNMKLSLNGALTIGTLDGANIEIREHVGASEFFLFGMTAEQVAARRTARFEGAAAIGNNPRLQQVMALLSSNELCGDDTGRYAMLTEAWQAYDPFMVAADFSAYWDAQRDDVDAAWRDPARWWRSSILNTARMGWFSSDRAIRDYAQDIWRVPLP